MIVGSVFSGHIFAIKTRCVEEINIHKIEIDKQIFSLWNEGNQQELATISLLEVGLRLVVKVECINDDLYGNKHGIESMYSRCFSTSICIIVYVATSVLYTMITILIAGAFVWIVIVGRNGSSHQHYRPLKSHG
uniref:AlNc14C41G3487 protein n=1 Tax=Albugo laibachii Nc14 TaxID=890382 RepID=F0W9N2_9STRA|nr:AlNc14C41G3487 [Albugo laibachii Nc14]|eukprot:CCA17850.1 AlNc14C41G3487 [Albugo laibachii Nc14]